MIENEFPKRMYDVRVKEGGVKWTNRGANTGAKLLKGAGLSDEWKRHNRE